MDAAEIKIKASVDGSAVSSGLAAMSAGFARFQATATQSLRSVTTAFSGLTAAQRLLTGLGVGIGILAIGLASVTGPAIEFESAFAGVRKTVDGTPEQLNQIRSGLLDLSTVMPTTAAELASIAENAGQLGVAAPEVLRFTEVVAQLGETTDLDFDEAAQSLARFLNITGSGAAGIERVADVLVDLGNNSATTESQIVNFSTRLASAFTVAGASEDQILGLAAAFSSLGLRAEAGGSALSRIITSISDAAVNGGFELRVYAETAGLLPEQFAAIARENPVEALLLFGEGLARVRQEGGSITPILEDLELGGLRTSEVFRLLALNSDFVRESLNRAADEYATGGAAAEEYGKRIETTASRIDILRNRLNTLAINVGTPTLDLLALSADTAGDAVLRLADTLSPLARQIVDLASNIGQAGADLLAPFAGPSIAVALGGLEALTGTLSAVLDLLSLVDARVLIFGALVADIALVGPVSIAASAGLRSLGLGATFAATGVFTLSTAISALAIAGVVGGAIIALTVMGDEIETIGQASRRAGQEFRDTFVEALSDGRLDEARTELSRVRERIEEINNTPGVNLDNTVGGWVQGFENLLGAANAFSDDPSVFELRGELEALQGELDRTNLDEYITGLDRLADRFGVSADVVDQYANELGVVEQVADLGRISSEKFASVQTDVTNALGAVIAANGELADTLGVTSDELLDNVFGSAALAEALGITEQQLAFVAARLDDVDFADLFSDDDEVRIAAIDALIGEVDGRLAGLAETAGLTTGEFLTQSQALETLSGAYDALQASIAATETALGNIGRLQENAAEAAVNHAEALAGFDGSEESFREVETAARALVSAEAALADSGTEAIQVQRDLAADVLNNAEAYNLSSEQAARLADSILSIPAEKVLEFQELGFAQRLAELETLRAATAERLQLQIDSAPVEQKFALLFELVSEYSQPVTTELLVEDNATDTIQGLLNLAGTWFGSRTVVFTAEDQATGTIEGLLNLAGSWFGSRNVTLTATDEAQPVIENARQFLEGWSTGPYTAPLTAEDQTGPTVSAATDSLLAMTIREYRATISARKEELDAAVSASLEQLGSIDAFIATSTIDADPAPFDGKVAGAEGELGRIGELTAIPGIDADPGAFDGKIADAEGDLGRVDDTVAIPGVDANLDRFKRGVGEVIAAVATLNQTTATPTITANTSVAEARLIRIINLIGAIRSKSVTITTNHRSNYINSGGSITPQGPTTPTYDPYRSGAVLADGGILGRASVSSYQGPIIDPPVGPVSGWAKRERVGSAKIYSPISPGRFFAEPETGGESFIPLAPSKRAQSIRIWELTGRHLGVFANGGIQVPTHMRQYNNGGIASPPRATFQATPTQQIVQYAPQVNLSIEGTEGMDEQRVVELARAAIVDTLDRSGRDLLNMI